MFSHDVFAETNPAWGTYVLTGLLRGFIGARGTGADLPIAYLGLPISLSGDLASTFDGTNVRTGLREWVERSPQIQLELGERLNASLTIVSDAVRLGCFTKAIALDEAGKLSPIPGLLPADLARGKSADLSGPVKRAERLGYWFGNAGTTKTVFDILGLSL